MKLVKPTFKIIEQGPGMDGMYENIEFAGRNCYKSNSKFRWYNNDKSKFIDEGTQEWKNLEDPKLIYPIKGENISAKPFATNMVNNKHYAMLEHGALYFIYKCKWEGDGFTDKYERNKFSRVVSVPTKEIDSDGWAVSIFYISTNYRVIVENGWEDDLKYRCEPTEYHDKRITIDFISDIHFYKDTTRHRVMSWAIESTRFCNYLKEKFGSSISFAIPCWLKVEDEEEFKKDLEVIESIYFKWIDRGWKPEEAAYFLIQGTKAEIIMTGYQSDFYHFFDLRSALHKTGKPLPTVEELVEPLRQEFIKKGYVKYD